MLVSIEVLSFHFRKHSIWKSGRSANSKVRPERRKPATQTEKNIDASRRNLCKDSFVEGKELRKPLFNCASKQNNSEVDGTLLEAKTEPKLDKTQDPPSLPDVMVVKVNRKTAVPVTRASKSTSSLRESDSTSRSRTQEGDVKASGGSRASKQRSTSSFARPTLSAKAKQVTAQSRPTSASSTKHAATPHSKKPAKPSVVITGRRLQFSDKKRRF